MPVRGTSRCYALAAALACSISVPAAAPEQQNGMLPGARQVKAGAAAAPAAPTPSKDRDYVLGADDQISVWVADAADISGRQVNIDPGGDITLPMIGRVRAAGLTTKQLEAELTEKLKTYFKAPQVVVSVTEFRSQPVSVIGAVNQPGVHQLRGRKTLVEVLSLAGGIAKDAGYTVKITRGVEWGPIPLANAKKDPSGQFTIAQVELKDIMTAANPQGNIPIRPNDVISVPVGEMVYVIGEVNKAGGFVLAERENISVLQALALAGGLSPQASPKNARILRAQAGSTSRTEIPIDVRKVLQGQAKDASLNSEDILFIPNSVSKKAGLRVVE